MRVKQMLLLLSLSCGFCAGPLSAQQSTFGGEAGADLSIEAMEPSNEPSNEPDISEQTSDDSHDIAHFLMANGANKSRLSPDGRSIVFTWSISGQDELWHIPTAGGEPRQLTTSTGIDMFVWLPDSSGILYAADQDGNEQEGYFSVSISDGAHHPILPAARGDFRMFGDFVGADSFVYASTARNGLDFDIYMADLAGNSELIFEGRYEFKPHAVSPDGRYAIVTEAVGEDANRLHLLDLNSRALTTISNPSPRADHDLGGFVWAPNSKSFIYSSNAGREFGAFRLYNVETGEDKIVTENEGDIGDLAYCGGSRTSAAYSVSRDGYDGLWLDDETHEKSRIFGLPEGSYELDCSQETGLLMIHVDGWQTPGDIYVLGPQDEMPRRVFASDFGNVDSDELVRPQVLRYPASDGVELQGLLYLPPASARNGNIAPVVFSVHGGPSGQAAPKFNPVAQYYAARGIAVFEPNVRGSTGLGRTYSTLDDQEKRLDSVRDLVDLLAALGDDGLIDPSRAVVKGGSYGGYMVNAVLTEFPESFDAGIALYGVGNWINALEIASPSLKASDLIEFGDISQPHWRDFYREISPIFHADEIRVPVLYSHGMADPRIDISETEVMVRALRENGIYAPFIRIPDEGHGWARRSNQLFYFRKEAEFLEAQLGLTRNEAGVEQ